MGRPQVQAYLGIYIAALNPIIAPSRVVTPQARLCYNLLKKTDIVLVDPLSIKGRNFTINNIYITISYNIGLSISKEGVIFDRSIISKSK